MVLLPSAPRAAISRATPALMSGLLMVMPRRLCILSQSYYGGPVRVAKNDLGAHLHQLIDEKQPAFEHFLVDQYRTSRLGGHHQHDAQQVGCKTRPGVIIDGKDGAIKEALDLVAVLCRNINVIPSEFHLDAELSEFLGYHVQGH